MVIRGAEKKPYHLLDGVIPLDDDDDLFDRLLGLVTENLARPLSGYRPEAPFKAKDQFKEPKCLYPKRAVECEDVTWLEAHTVEENAKAEFSKLVKLWGSYTKKKDNEWGSTLLRRVEIQDNPRDRIKELLQVPAYEAGVRELMEHQDGFGKKRTLGVITGFITCTDMTANKGAEKSTSFGAAATLVPEEATGVPGTKVDAEASVKKTLHKRITGAYKGEVVVACYYLPIIGQVNTSAASKFKIADYLPPWFYTKPPESRLQVSAEPMPVYGDPNNNEMTGGEVAGSAGGTAESGVSMSFMINRIPIKGNMDRPLGTDGRPSEDDEEYKRQSLLKYLEDPEDLGFTIGRAISIDTPKSA
ncbi:uncharacterized protein FTOL_00011 [Fusarium torulosum]|uniref:Uncharacterized protein n=1 Tax=Fusarium torulosum TaxID=33205 RepID=A0AAE8LXQ9_9HYPO|nr:uncharacterized protein FTOL_00011 [Fusarium torulosum]